MTEQARLDQICINTLRTLSIDAVQHANSGHPGTPMGMAPVAYCLWQRFLHYDPDHPDWANRDRFVLSAGHACALLYSLLYLSGVKALSREEGQAPQLAVPLDELKRFRQLGSRCSGHPEYGLTTGVETTTGPLGQGAATSVGMAMAERWLAATYNRPGYEIFNYKVYALCSDGDLMEGIASEAASLAGHLKLANLCWVYDDNHITIEGSTNLAFTEDVAARFSAYGWHVRRVGDANDLQALSHAYTSFGRTTDRPTLIVVRSHIGYGAPHKQDTREAHGEPLGAEEVRLAKEFYGSDPAIDFDIPKGVRANFAEQFGRRGDQAFAAWETSYAAYRAQYPDLAEQIDAIQKRSLPAGWDASLPEFKADDKGQATRESSGKVLNQVAAGVPWLLGGAADLAPSTKTGLGNALAASFQAPGQGGDYSGRNFHFGLREHAMCAIASGLSLSGLRPFVASFFVFTDYCRAAIRLSAMMRLPVIYIWTHDSIALGEDGPTHQPVGQLAGLRAMPGMIVIRPADANEVVAAWRVIMQINHCPVSLLLTRQAVPTFDRTRYASADGAARGAYILAEAPGGTPVVLLIGTGSEVALCLEAYEQLASEGIEARVVSMPSWELFEMQSQSYRDSVLPPSVLARVAVEAATPFGWERYTGITGAILAVREYGMSAPGKDVARHFGFDAGHVVAAARSQVEMHGHHD